MQKATIRDPQFVGDDEYQVVYGVLVAHPRAGEPHLHVGRLIRTSQVVRKYKNGNFRTLNTHYKVLPS